MSRKLKNTEDVSKYYRAIMLEQDQMSPHRYLTKSFDVDEGDVVIDVGVAEGNFALDVIDRVKKIYLIETDEEWIDALKLTFAEYGDKVSIIKGFVSSYNEKPYITIDSVVDDEVNFIKMDIEGNEWDGLRGSIETINRSHKIKLAVCAYHNDFDKTLIEKFMDDNEISHYTSHGYMWFPYKTKQNYVSTSLNRAIVRGYKIR